MSGWALLDDLLPIVWVNDGGCSITFDECEEARLILDNRDLDGNVQSSDPAYNLAKHLMCYQLNQGAGAYICPSMLPLEDEAVQLLMMLCFDGHGSYLKKTNSPSLKALASRANELAGIFDAYNNNLGCYDGPVSEPDPEPSGDFALVCPANLTIPNKLDKLNQKAYDTWLASAYTEGCYVIVTNDAPVTVPAPGQSVTVTFTVESDCEGTLAEPLSCTATFTVDPSKSAELEGVNAFEYADLKVYPNPFNERVRFEFVSPETAQAQIDVFDITGRKVKTIFEQQVEGGITYYTEFEPTTVVSGLYYYRMQLGKAVFNGKLIYQKE